MTEKFTPAVEVLLAAADILEVDGWHQGSMYGPSSGPGQPYTCCAIGAVSRAENILRVTDYGTAKQLENAAALLYETKPARVKGLLATAYYNDHVATSVEEVTALLRATASEIFEKGYIS